MMTLKRMLNLIPIISLFAFSVLLLSCHTSTENKHGAVSGEILITGETDCANIHVFVFSDQGLPDRIDEIRQSYPNLGFNYTSLDLFDHRQQLPTMEAVTDPQGHFSLTSLPYGDYVLMYFKEGWGISSNYSISVDQEILTLPSGYLAPLHAVSLVPAIVSEDFTFSSGVTYFIENTTTLLPDNTMTIQPGTKILIAPGKKLSIAGTLVCTATAQNMALITSSDDIYQCNTTVQPADLLEILPNGSVGELGFLRISHLYNGLVIKCPNSVLIDSIISDCVFGVVIIGVSSISLSNNLFYDNTEAAGCAVGVNTAGNLLINNNVFIDNSNSIQIEQTEYSMTKDNYFFGGNPFNHMLYSHGTLSHNVFVNALIAIQNASRSNLSIQYNSISADIGVYLPNTIYNTLEEGWTVANLNNINAVIYSVRAQTRYYSPSAYYPLNFSNNYWNTTNIESIQNSIWDYEDEPTTPIECVWGRVEYLPIKTNTITSAGISSKF
ncbi:MAG TPA: right-handed parallel beta-helix repeat-containing protein [Candidatus Cloacimonadota bacterium]|nr:right-handed parallel beta-helix repeat-containing protein [Candidatus Cloacimonadota bacterium]